MKNSKESSIPPYISYRTFTNFLNELRARGLPSRVDRSVMAHKSGTIQSQLLLALNYLGLLRGSGQPTDQLKQLIESTDQPRQGVLRGILKTSYGFVFKSDIGLQTATSDQAEELFEQTGASGETVRRSIAFFLAAAKDSGIPISDYIQPHKRRRSATRTARAGRPQEAKTSVLEVDPGLAGDFKKVTLKSGGSVKLELAIDMFELADRDREFVFGLIDRLKEYEQQ
ncbi:MAG: DUF5343 domain-containing protein [Acidobacteriota bacterium]|nr:DUF5343 domain-containing protein [Acidobacteriota bacterium]